MTAARAMKSAARPARRPIRAARRLSLPLWARTALGVVVLAAKAFWRVVGPAITVVSATGWSVLLIAVVALVAGRMLGWQEFFYLGVTLAAAFICAFAFMFGRAAYSVEIDLTPRRVVAGERALGRVLVSNRRKRRSAPSRLELPVGAGIAEFGIPALATNDEHEELFAVPTHRRAVIVAGPARSVRGDQLGIIRRTVTWTDPVELFVHPVITPLSPSAAGLVRDLEGEVTKTITNSDISFHALRAYEPGDDRRYVHWRTSARTGQLMVRQFEETRRSELTMLFAGDSRHFASADEFELAVSILASLGVQVIRDGTRVTVHTENLDVGTRSIASFLDDTCRIEPSADVFATGRDFARTRTSTDAAPSVVMIVSGSLFPLSEFRSIQVLFGRDTQTLGFRAEPDGSPRLALLAGMRVATVSALGDLSRLVRSAS